MSIAANPSHWYSSLINYKHGSKDDLTLVSAMIAAYLTAHEDRLVGMLGGSISHVVTVPSTKGKPFREQPLAKAVSRSARFRERLVDGLAHVPGAALKRQEYKPAIFTSPPGAVDGGRIVLIEDLWVSGATAVSGAGALLASGARSVVIVPVGREIRVDTDFCPGEYVDLARQPYDVDAWPR